MLIASFDIGKKNFAFCVEEVSPEMIRSFPEKQREDRIDRHGTILLLENVDLTTHTNTSKYLDPMVFVNMNRVLDTYISLWNKCNVVLIEQQMSFGNQRNGMAVKLAQHCYSYFVFHYAQFKTIIEFPSYHKTQVMNAPKQMTKPQRKKWAVVKAVEILRDRNDTEHLHALQSVKKKDDMADVILQVQSFKRLHFIHNIYGTNK